MSFIVSPDSLSLAHSSLFHAYTQHTLILILSWFSSIVKRLSIWHSNLGIHGVMLLSHFLSDRWPHIEQLEISHSAVHADSLQLLGKSVRRLSHITSLEMLDCGLDDDAMAALFSTPALQDSLALSLTPMHATASLPSSLQHLGLASNHLISPTMLAAAIGRSSVVSLDLSYNPLGHAVAHNEQCEKKLEAV